MRLLRFFLLIFVLLDGCIEPLSIKTPASSPKLVVDGLITDAPGPYQVQLTYSSDFDKDLKKPQPETGSTVSIVDDLNVEAFLSEIKPGIYQTTGLQGQAGKSYHVKIKTKSGKEYQSQPQKLLPAGTLSNLYFEFEKNALTDAQGHELDALNIFLDAQGLPGESELFRWRWTGIYEVLSFPQSRTRVIPFTRPPAYEPIPEACSGYEYINNALVRTGDCICCSCWSYEQNNASLVSENRFANDVLFNKIKVAQISIDKVRFYKRYHIEVEQLSLSDETYNFWQLVGAQQKAVGSLFQPNTVKVYGNIASVTDPAEEVLGVFDVSGSAKKSLFIERDMLPYTLEPIDSIPRDCRASYPYASNVRPPFW